MRKSKKQKSNASSSKETIKNMEASAAALNSIRELLVNGAFPVSEAQRILSSIAFVDVLRKSVASDLAAATTPSEPQPTSEVPSNG